MSNNLNLPYLNIPYLDILNLGVKFTMIGLKSASLAWTPGARGYLG